MGQANRVRIGHAPVLIIADLPCLTLIEESLSALMSCMFCEIARMIRVHIMQAILVYLPGV